MVRGGGKSTCRPTILNWSSRSVCGRSLPNPDVCECSKVEAQFLDYSMRRQPRGSKVGDLPRRPA